MRFIDRSQPEPLVVELEDGGGRVSVTPEDISVNAIRNSRREHAAYLGEVVGPPHWLGAALLAARYIPPQLHGEAERQRRVERELRGH
jgi:hypothetical protein